MKPKLNPLVGWPLIALNLLVLTNAQAQIARWKCEADCFALQADGTSLVYAGYYQSGYFKKRSDAFKDIRNYGCAAPDLLLKRDFKGMVSNGTPVDVTNRYRSSHWTYHGLQTHNQVRHYQIISNELRAVFDVQEATENNACKEVPIEPEMIDQLPNGDRVLG